MILLAWLRCNIIYRFCVLPFLVNSLVKIIFYQNHSTILYFNITMFGFEIGFIDYFLFLAEIWCKTVGSFKILIKNVRQISELTIDDDRSFSTVS